MRKTEYDFLSWTSFPSSAKLINDEKDDALAAPWTPNLPIIPGSMLRVEVKVRQQNVPPCPAPHVGYAYIWHKVWDGSKWTIWGWVPYSEREIPPTSDWATFELYRVKVPDGFTAISFAPHLWGSGDPTRPWMAWFDDLKIYQDDVLIYSNDFSNWNPIIGAGVGAGILGVVVPAVVRVPEPGVAYEYQKPMLEKEPLLAAGLAGLGILVGGGIGLLTGFGIIPVPQIPALGAAPEGPGAPARLGKYLITG